MNREHLLSNSSELVMHRFYKANMLKWVCDLASDSTVSCRMRAACVLCSVKHIAGCTGDAEVTLRVEAPLAALQGDTSAHVCACANEVHTLLPACPASPAAYMSLIHVHRTSVQ